jgi:predicted nucleic acid-binding protein
MGVILDSSALIRAERRGQTEVQMLREVGELTGGDDLGLSAVCVTEFLHGIYRAKDASRRGRREMFFEQLLADIPVYEFTLSAARLAGRIGGEQAELGVPNSIFGSVSDLPLWNSTLLF